MRPCICLTLLFLCAGTLACSDLDSMRNAGKEADDATQTGNTAQNGIDDPLLPDAPDLPDSTGSNSNQDTDNNPPASGNSQGQTGSSTSNPPTTSQPPPKSLVMGINMFNTGISGNENGSFFHAQCPTGQVLIGLDGLVTNKVSQLRILCSPFKAGNFGETSTGLNAGAIQGSGGDRAFALKCYGNNVVRALSGMSREGVCQLRVGCIEIKQASISQRTATFEVLESCDKDIPLISKITKKPFNMSCGPQSVAVGVQGRAGEFINAIGLVCLDLVLNPAQ